ncbi:hypothetical protein [Rhodoferax lacus]|nr:hypothetical protein [Rhodoferax lacus]
MSHISERFIGAIARNLAELQRAIHNRDAMTVLETERATGYAIFRVAYLALYNDYMAHAMKVFENSRRVASIWYLYRTDQGVCDGFMRKASIDIQAIKEMSARLKTVRDSTHFHIDVESVADTKSVWREAGIKGSALSGAVDNAWCVVTHLQQHYGLPVVELLPEFNKEHLRKQVRQFMLSGTA